VSTLDLRKTKKTGRRKEIAGSGETGGNSVNWRGDEAEKVRKSLLGGGK